ncbi:alpha-1A adrenergic receptor-like [Actinia tenebrosa]|uniref:Alpha-1A adrenergic receptor-like n=1 Tax=Actinia tenebrosa TaxID=6105 RepID=A0A6P8HFX1_ACTTE|nr:alpha-1A adrenergic receptor-like [Actinia tenebrosa]XP_031551482.1 alpha-1A adrenergic receptor-like [Actinia tenebrosa]XP_031551483.1 alpha-1A adrenergic receptor-like [Actinia tenebrosa]XP_031551484.1 alpha-1A adrenergic receptor-like [Actinia tenebrosa]XP_031551485.1 alpha-1A adrenergic receptor-like [Actinia tenebrosa]XP_031551486.1 alpha-1A adrenergic receptor-like [Actinia tenebrosa]XP_031551487.1 alpha-1A adrenergic receptor-like [Actinia tenebrosa]
MALNQTSIQNSTTPPDPYIIEEPPQLTTIRIIVFSLVIFLGLLGNTVVIRAIRSGRSRKPLTHYLVTSLAVAELLNSTFLIFPFVYAELWHWIFGAFLCHFIMPSMVVTFGVATNTLACISIYRYLVIVTPTKMLPTKRVSLGIVTGIWLISFAVALPLYPLYVHEEMHPGYYYCHVLHDLRIYDMVRIALQFFAPVLIMIVSYAVAAVKIKEHMTFMENRSRQNRLNSNISTLNTFLESQVNGDNNVNLLTVPPHQYQQVIYAPNDRFPHGSACHINRIPDQAMDYAASKSLSSHDEGSMIESERDIIKMFYVIVMVFLIFYLPYQVFFLCVYYGVLDRNRHPYYDLLDKYTVLLVSFPSALHPLCYGTMSSFYARAFSKLILCKRNK